MAFCLVALYYYYYGKKKKAFIWIVFGCLFQTYTIIAIPIILLYKACKRVSRSSNFKMFKVLLFYQCADCVNVFIANCRDL